MEHRQVIAYQQDLFTGQTKNAIRQSDNCKDVNQAKAGQAEKVNKERQQGRALAEDLMTTVCSSHNLKQAYKRVKRNKGVAGIDQMPIGRAIPQRTKGTPQGSSLSPLLSNIVLDELDKELEKRLVA